jgi:demethylmenaquinone methyltransferase / 2-methoxy-6-polyprenyl-1,4-benzoquinol methylase
MQARKPLAQKTSTNTSSDFRSRPADALDEKQAAVRAIFDRIAPAYDRFNAWASLGLHQQWRKNLVARIPRGARVLDVATGTGDVAFLAADHGHEVIALDFSDRMLAQAREKDRDRRIRWVEGSADRLPFSDRSFGCVTSAFALRNVRGNLKGVFSENFRVLKANGKVIHMDFGKPSGVMRWGHKIHLRLGVPFIGQTVCGEQWPKGYLETTIEQFYAPEEILAMLKDAGFASLRHSPLLWGAVQIYEGYKPSC